MAAPGINGDILALVDTGGKVQPASLKWWEDVNGKLIRMEWRVADGATVIWEEDMCEIFAEWAEEQEEGASADRGQVLVKWYVKFRNNMDGGSDSE